MKNKVKYTDDHGELKGKWKTIAGETIGIAKPEVFQHVHGGIRPGAGRKPAGRVQYTTRLKPALIRRIKATAKKSGKAECEVVEILLSQVL